MKKFNVSYWESETFLKYPDIAIIGGGIVGINTAITLKENNSRLDIMVIDRNSFPLGASTRNAGFACFGSVTELIDDLETSSEEDVFQLLNDRKLGLDMLRKRVGDQNMAYENTGSFELFDKADDNLSTYKEYIRFLNARIYDKIGFKDTFEAREKLDFPFPGFADFNIYNKYEGQINPGKMIQTLYNIASKLGIRFLMGHEIKEIFEENGMVNITSSNFIIKSRYAVVCTNGFTKHIFPEINLLPARNQVLVTQEIPNLDWKACFHYDKGYIYFRNIGKRLLIGGARNIAKLNETTTELDLTDEILDHLKEFVHQKLGISPDFKFEFQWSGIMGVGNVKNPIIKKYSEHIILAVRLGGMGIALGTLVGSKAADLLLSENI